MNKEEKLKAYQDIIQPSLRKIIAEEIKLSDKVWYTRHLCFKKSPEWKSTPEDIRNGALKSADKAIKKYGEEWLLDYKDDFEWGVINGKLAMIRWIITGIEDNLDT